MSAIGTFRFPPNFILRPAGAIATDRLLAKQWTEADPDHCGRVKPEFWLEQDFDIDSYLLLDAEGPLFFWKGIIRLDELLSRPSARVIEMHIQFPPAMDSRELRARIREGLVEGLHWLEQILHQAKVLEIYFDSTNPVLIYFCENRLGFTREGLRLRKRLISPPVGRNASGNQNTSEAGNVRSN